MRAILALLLLAVAAVHAHGTDGTGMGAGEDPTTYTPPEDEFQYTYDDHVYGVDVSQPVSVDSFRCLNSNNLTFAVVRCWQSPGYADPNCPSTIANAWAGGLAHVDAYMFPCVPCGNPSGQVSDLVSYLDSHGVKYGMIWLDIESLAWSSSQASNRAFFEGLRNEVVAKGKKLGIYSSASQWDPIMGSDYTGGSSYPIWYAHYDGIPDFSDWRDFGGWTKPSIKQFSDKGAKCGASYDINWYPPGAKPHWL